MRWMIKSADGYTEPAMAKGMKYVRFVDDPADKLLKKKAARSAE